MLAIPLASLRVDTVMGFDLYLQTRAGQPPVLFRQKNLPFQAHVLSRIEDHRHHQVFIRTSDSDAYVRYLEDNLSRILRDDFLDVQEKSGVLYQCAKGLMFEVMAEPRAKGLMRRCKQLVETTVDFMRGEEVSFRHLLKVVSYDYYTYTHSVNVFVFGVALAEYVGHPKMDELRAFGEGTLLHDVGKSVIDPTIVNSPGQLSPDEWAEIKRHPTYGVEILSEQGVTNEMTLDVVQHHHEKLTGAGYPDGLFFDEIPFYVRIATIADIFDALTTRRPYKEALKSFPALSLMKQEMSEELDQELFSAMVKLMATSE